MSNSLSIRTSALGFAARVKDGDTLDTAYATAIKAKEDSQASPFVIFCALRDEFGEDLASWPRPGSGTKDNPAVGNESPDYWEVTTGEGKITGSFYGDFADNTPRGKWIAGELAKINAASRKDDPENNEYRKLGLPKMRKEKARWAQRQSTLRTNTRMAMKVLHQIDRVSGMTGIGVELENETDKDGKIVGGAIVVFDEAKRGNVKYYTPKGFLNLRPGKAEDEGGGWEKLVTSDARQPKPPEQAVLYPEIDGMTKFDLCSAAFTNFMERITGDEKAKTQVIRELGNGKNDHLLATLFKMEDLLSNLTTVKALAERNSKIVRGEIKVGEAAA